MEFNLDSAIRYAHDRGFDEGYEEAMQEMESAPKCEIYVIDEGYQCGNCGEVFDEIPVVCECGSRVASIIDEG